MNLLDDVHWHCVKDQRLRARVTWLRNAYEYDALPQIRRPSQLMQTARPPVSGQWGRPTSQIRWKGRRRPAIHMSSAPYPSPPLLYTDDEGKSPSRYRADLVAATWNLGPGVKPLLCQHDRGSLCTHAVVVTAKTIQSQADLSLSDNDGRT